MRVVVVLEEVETPHLVGAVVRAIAGADAAVVDHVVEALGAVHRGGDGADHLAGRLLALHAGHGLKMHRGLLRSAVEIAVDTNPVHLAPARDLVLADDGDVVFRLARHDAGVAARATAEIDRHRPGVILVREGGIKIVLRIGGWIFLRQTVRIEMVIGQGLHADDVAAFHGKMMLGGGQRVGAAGGLERRKGDHRLSRIGGPQRVRIEAHAIRHRAHA